LCLHEKSGLFANSGSKITKAILMNFDYLTRTELLIGSETLDSLSRKKVLVVGLGGVGAYAAEMLCRAGIGNLSIIDGDRIEMSNINRQLPATTATIGMYKTEILVERFLEINPSIAINNYTEYIRGDRITEVVNTGFDYIIDAIDVLTHKVALISASLKRGTPIVSSMGTGGKLDPSMIKISDIEKTYNCRLAKMVRKRLHRREIHGGFKAVFSPEPVRGEIIAPTAKDTDEENSFKNAMSTVGTISYIPAIFGCFCASEAINFFITSKENPERKNV